MVLATSNPSETVVNEQGSSRAFQRVYERGVFDRTTRSLIHTSKLEVRRGETFGGGKLTRKDSMRGEHQCAGLHEHYEQDRKQTPEIHRNPGAYNTVLHNGSE